MPGLAKGHRKTTDYGAREYMVLAGPFDTNDGRLKVYVIRDKGDGQVRLMGYKHFESLPDAPEED